MKREPVRVMVTLKNFNPETQTRYEEKKEANFHCWGYRQAKTGTPKPGPCETVGICELEDGRIRLVKPESIQFLRSKPQPGVINDTNDSAT